jgi:hypothetical protein
LKKPYSPNRHNIEFKGQALRSIKHRPVQIGLVTIVFLSLTFVPFTENTKAQTTTTFTSTDEFSIPEFNGFINFAVNGSYTTATLQNHSWTFTGLSLNNSQYRGALTVSAENSNVTITDFRPSGIVGRSQVIRYITQGQGTQTVNLHLNQTTPTHGSEWMVILSPSIFLSEGSGWNLQSDNTVLLNGLVGNVTVFHYVLDIPDDSGLPFYLQHSVALITVGVVAAVLVAAVLLLALKAGR